MKRLRVGVCVSSETTADVVVERTFFEGEEVWLGDDPHSTVPVPNWAGAPLLLISADGFLHLHEGMRVNMCGPSGVNRVVGTYAELKMQATPLPIPVLLRTMTISVRKGLSIFARYLRDDEA